MLLAALAAALVALAAGPVAGASASLSITSPTNGEVTNVGHVPITGTSEPLAPVTVTISHSGGGTAAGPFLLSAGETWSTAGETYELAEGKYTATAEQALERAEVGFTVITRTPEPTLSEPSGVINTATPTFSGTTNEGSTGVVVQIVNNATHAEVQASGNPSGGNWSASNEPELPEGEYTATAYQESAFGNGTGHSGSLHFTVVTRTPKPTLSGPSGDINTATPGFSGTTNEDATGVVVHIVNNATHNEVQATATPNSGSWSTSNEPELAEGEYTATAYQGSAFGNGTGHSGSLHFTVITRTPEPTLSGPSGVINTATPGFSGATNENTTVFVQIVNNATHTEVQASGSPSGGHWSAANEPELPEGEYTATAYQESAFGNGTGHSGSLHFTVVLRTPKPTLSGPSGVINTATPGFSGTTNESTTVYVQIVNNATHAEVQASGNPSGGNWSAANEPELAEGEYTATAYQESSFGNGTGHSNSLHFTVITRTPKPTLSGPSGVITTATPGFSGTTNEGTTVYVQIVNNATHTEVQASGSPSGGHWAAANEPTLPEGEYTATAYQESAFGNGTGHSGSLHFTVVTRTPEPTLSGPTGTTGSTKPGFSGTTNETTTVVVHIVNNATHNEVQATATPSSGSWSTSNEAEIGEGEYTATAYQESSFGNGTGHSGSIHFTVHTKAPEVTLFAPESPSNHTRPTFSGTGSDHTQVTVSVYPAGHTEGTALATATASGTEGTWFSGETNNALASGTYTAVARQPSSLGNPTGVSAPVTFTIETGPPHVTLLQPEPLSNNTTPSFKGEASGGKTVVVEIFAGSSAVGHAVSSAAASGTHGSWTSGQASPALTTGEYTAVAHQESDLLGNPTGFSGEVHFSVDTRSPTVTLNAFEPSTFRYTKPLFSGTASDSTEVVVHIYNSEGHEVHQAGAHQSGGLWSSSAESELGEGEYTAKATQESSLHNPTGVSNEIRFKVVTVSPTVKLNSPAPRSNNTAPTFSGSASDSTAVTVHVLKGGTEVAFATASGTGGEWTSGSLSKALETGAYTAYATQPSSVGNPEGRSGTVGFEINTSSPSVTITQPALRSNNAVPSFSGTASDPAKPVSVQVYKGSTATGSPVRTLSATPSGESWSTATVSPELPEGEYTAIASQESSYGNPTGFSPATKPFVIDKQPPTVTLAALEKTISNNRTPVFTGTATETTPVTINIYKGETATGTPVATATGTPAAGKWTSAPSTELPTGDNKYTAVATETSGIGNSAGTSTAIKFTVDTTSPVLTITAPVAGSATKNRALTFSGTATGTDVTGKVKVTIFEVTPEKKVSVSSAEATVGTGGAWTSSAAKPELAEGEHEYEAVATEESTVGNPAGTTQVAFKVNTLPPKVTLAAVPSPSNSFKPEFKGTASDTTPVRIRIFYGRKAEGHELTSVSATPAAGAWHTAPVQLPEEHFTATYAAIAEQPSSIGNPTGKSTAIEIVVDPKSPSVSLNAPPAISNVAAPAFSGTAGASGTLTVRVYKGAEVPGGEQAQHELEAAHVTGTVSGFGWSLPPLSTPLADGVYTAQASDKTAAEDVGTSPAQTFIVDTTPPHITITASSAGASSVNVSGQAGAAPRDLSPVTVQLFAGGSSGGSQLQAVEVQSSHESWQASLGGLSPGTYTLRAQQHDEAGNTGSSADRTFTIAAPAAAPADPPPAAGFSWLPAHPYTGETVTLVSSSSDAASPISAFAWNLTGAAFATGGPSIATSFPTPGTHVVQLRVTAADGLSSTVSQAIPVQTSPLPLLRPFPVVRITSVGTHGGVRLTLLSVLAPAGSRVSVRCKGHGCPASRYLKTVSKKARSVFLVLRKFEGFLPAGVVLEISITKPGVIGKYTKLVVRSGRPLLRVDECMSGAASRPAGCPR